MQTVQPWMRLKVKADTHFVPVPDGSVYFRNNTGSFRMEGTSVLSWIEQLLPAFDGQESMGALTDGLPEPYRDRIYEIASILYSNGFLRDVSTDKAHGLSPSLLDAHRAQIEFLDNLVGSGAYRFEAYRNSNILVVGGGSLLSPLVDALLESGLANVHVHRAEPDSLANVLRTTDAVLYVDDSGDVESLRQIEAICHETETLLFPAFVVGSIGFVVPAIAPESGVHVAFDRVWRRVHPSVWERSLDISGFTDTAAAVLANVLVFELFKVVTGVDNATSLRLYTLDGETLEGTWHDVIPAGSPSPTASPQRVENLRDRLTGDENTESLVDALARFAQVTHSVTGIFHVWDEGDLEQVPLAKCRVQPIDPLSEGPATLLPERVCSALTHDDARREAGLVGIEAYVRTLAFGGADTTPSPCVGAGLTFAEAVGRGLQQALTHELKRVVHAKPYSVRPIQLGQVEDELCQFCVQSLHAVGHAPAIWRGEDVFGIPAVWMEHGGKWLGAVGLSTTLALQRVLSHVLLCESAGPAGTEATETSLVVEAPAHGVVRAKASVALLEVPPAAGFTDRFVNLALDALQERGADVEVVDLALEPFLQDVVAAVVGVTITWGESS